MIQMQGGVALQGKVRIQGSKNAALPILAATLLTKETSCIYNCPKIADVYSMLSLLECLGVSVRWEKDGVRIHPQEVQRGSLPAEAVKGMRSSLCLLGALLGRCREVVMEYPGGCVIGSRPIDIHILALQQMGVTFAEENGMLHARAEKMQGADIVLPFPSVGATENLILAAVAAEGVTTIRGAAREPEVEALCVYLQQCGAEIEGAGSSEITVCGGKALSGTEYRVPADRIVAGTYLFAALAAGGCVLLEEAPAEQMEAVIAVAEKMGAQCDAAKEGIYVQVLGRTKSVPLLRTAPYPGFPTDLQSPALAALTVAEGYSVVEEKIFENRFRIVEPLQTMGAKIFMPDKSTAIVQGVRELRGMPLESKELRGGAALVVAGLAAGGSSVIEGCSYIYRGYENICKDLRELGARITGVETNKRA